MSILTYFSKNRRHQRRKLRELKAFAARFSTLDRLEQSGLLVWDAKSRRLFISQTLAVLMMKDADSWLSFVTNVYQWVYYQRAQEAWNGHILKEELAAVRSASVGQNHETVQLSRADVDRIRLAARRQVAEDDIEPPKVEPFEMFIVEDTVDAKPRIIAVGYFDPEANSMEMAPWSEVEPIIRKGGDQ